MFNQARKHFLYLVAMTLIASGEKGKITIDLRGFRVLTNGVGVSLETEFAAYRDAIKKAKPKKFNVWRVY